MIVQLSVESGRGHFVVGTEPFELGTEAVVTVFRLVPEIGGLLWCDLQLMLEQLWQLVKIRLLTNTNKTSAFKSQQIHLSDLVGKMGENIILIPCPSSPLLPPVPHSTTLLFSKSLKEAGIQHNWFFYDSLVSYVARNVCKGAFCEDPTN